MNGKNSVKVLLIVLLFLVFVGLLNWGIDLK